VSALHISAPAWRACDAKAANEPCSDETTHTASLDGGQVQVVMWVRGATRQDRTSGEV
jgi:hypothetical protein